MRKTMVAQLLSIEDAYDAMEQDAFGRIEVDVFTVSGSIDAATQATLVDDLTRSLGKQPVLHFYADPAMIGGLKLRIGDQLIDGSVAAQLRRMRSTLLDKGLAGRDAGTFLS